MLINSFANKNRTLSSHAINHLFKGQSTLQKITFAFLEVSYTLKHTDNVSYWRIAS